MTYILGMEAKSSNIWALSIRNRILIFAIVVTLIPSMGLGWAFYTQTEQLLQEKAEQELHSIVTQAQREIGVWFKESSANVRVFSNSFVVTENLERFLSARQISGNNPSEPMATAIGVITEYLALVQSQFREYKRLLVLDSAGKIVAQSPMIENGFALPEDWWEQLENNKMIIGEIRDNHLQSEPTLIMAVPILSNKQTVIGLLATELRITGLESIVNSFPLTESTQISLVKEDGLILTTTDKHHKPGTSNHISGSRLITLFNNPMELSSYTNAHDIKVIGVLAPLSNLSWGIVMEKDYDQAFAEIIVLKNITILVTIILLTVFGIIAFMVSQSILSPLRRLIIGASRVATGDLSIKVPTNNRDELGFAISVFNDMVVRLRKNHEKLEKLSTVDSLTNLFNRKHLMESFALHLERYHRHKTPFSILMGDLDHFKQTNDHYGHLAGDAVLVRIGEIFQKMLRSIDTAGRYGGEEFLIILDETREHQAQQTAERIRKAIEDTEVTVDGETIKTTISIGVATIKDGIDSETALISEADKALYEAKKAGRNRVVLSTSKVVPLPTAKANKKGEGD